MRIVMQMRAVVLGVLSVVAVVASGAPVRDKFVEAELVSSVRAIVPGKTFSVALRLKHDPHWHTYWINPGTGYATTLAWQLPEGWSHGPILWPSPVQIRDPSGNLAGNGYEGEAFLPVELTPPPGLEPGSVVRLAARAEWLMCEATCVPGTADLALELPVEREPRSEAVPDERWAGAIAEAHQRRPQPADGWKLAASRVEGGVVELAVSPAGGSGVEPGAVWFFSDDAQIDYAARQEVRRIDSGGLVVRLVVDPAGPAGAGRLTGDLVASDGWGVGGRPYSLRVDVPYAGPGAAVPALSLGLLGVAFLGGLILNAMPCVFPVLGLKVLGFAQQAGKERRVVVVHGLAFTAGILMSFWVLAAVLLVLKSAGAALGWGFQLQSPAFVYGLASLVLLFALNLSGVFEVGMGAVGLAGAAPTSGVSGSFLSGVLATVVATPCSAPFVGTALAGALSMPVLGSFAMFTAMALGLASPYLALSMFPKAVRWMPRPGPWMETLKQVLAFPLYATVAYLVWTLAALVADNDQGLLVAMGGLVVLAFAAWVYGRFARFGVAAGQAWAARGAALGLAAVGLVAGLRAGGAAPSEWRPWSREAVAAAVASGRPVFVDFTARWCFTCQTNKAAVFGSAEVNDRFRELKVVKLRADWTRRDAVITAELARFGRAAVPFNLVYVPGEVEPRVLPDLLTPSVVLAAFESVDVDQRAQRGG